MRFFDTGHFALETHAAEIAAAIRDFLPLIPRPVSVQASAELSVGVNGFCDMAGLPLIVFDVNETLLDLGTMEPTFERIFGDRRAMRLWFANLIMYSAALTVAGCYVPFTDIGAAVMKMLADTQGIKIDDSDKEELRRSFRRCRRTGRYQPRCASCAMQASGCSRSPTTCSRCKPASSSTAASSGLFERRFSADGVKHHKPSRRGVWLC